MSGLVHSGLGVLVPTVLLRCLETVDEDAPMADMASDFIRDYQTLAQRSWNNWSRQLQQPQPSMNPFAPPPPAPPAGNDMLERTLAGLKGYFDWMQGAAAGGAAPSMDWRQQLKQMFGNGGQPFSQAFAGIDSAGAEGFAKQWQSWMQAAQKQGSAGMPGAFEAMPAFGQYREQQAQQQALATAVMEAMQASARYQALLQRASAQGMERLQDKLARQAEPGRQIDSMKALYDLWVDASEEAYAEIALSDEFSEVYGDMVNSQMRVRKMQQQQTEQLCQQMGVPTRSEVSSLGERLQALRRESRAGQPSTSSDKEDELSALKRELATLKRQLARNATPTENKVSPKKSAAPKETAPAKRTSAAIAKKTSVKAAPAKKTAVRKTARKAASGKSKPPAASKSRTSPRKRK